MKIEKAAGNIVHGARIELATRGFSVRGKRPGNTEKNANSRGRWDPNGILVAVVAAFSMACGGQAIGLDGHDGADGKDGRDFDPAKIYRVESQNPFTSSIVAAVSCKKAGDVVITGGCDLRGPSPDTWLQESAPTVSGDGAFQGWGCRAWVDQHSGVIMDHELVVSVACYEVKP